MKRNKSIFVEFFGDYPIIRVFDFLIENQEFDYSKKDISRYSNISWNSLETFWEKLLKRKIVVYTRKVGKAKMYKLNYKNPVVKELIELDKKLVRESVRDIGKRKIKLKTRGKN